MNMPKFQDAHLGPGRETKTASAFRGVLGHDWNLSDRTQNRDEESGEKTKAGSNYAEASQKFN